jgi:hypothetical protein
MTTIDHATAKLEEALDGIDVTKQPEEQPDAMLLAYMRLLALEELMTDEETDR